MVLICKCIGKILYRLIVIVMISSGFTSEAIILHYQHFRTYIGIIGRFLRAILILSIYFRLTFLIFRYFLRFYIWFFKFFVFLFNNCLFFPTFIIILLFLHNNIRNSLSLLIFVLWLVTLFLFQILHHT